MNNDYVEEVLKTYILYVFVYPAILDVMTTLLNMIGLWVGGAPSLLFYTFSSVSDFGSAEIVREWKFLQRCTTAHSKTSNKYHSLITIFTFAFTSTERSLAFLTYTDLRLRKEYRKLWPIVLRKQLNAFVFRTYVMVPGRVRYVIPVLGYIPSCYSRSLPNKTHLSLLTNNNHSHNIY
jgi:hypothetical protein